MTTIDTSWYELIGDPRMKKKLVNCRTYASALSLEELKEVRIECPAPMTKASFAIKDRAGNTVKEGCFELSKEGINEFGLKELLPFEELKPYETADAAYSIEMGVTLTTGDELSGIRVFCCNLHAGETSTKIPTTDLPAALNAIPIAKPGMTEEELRQICLDYMKLQTQFRYKLEKDYHYVVESQMLPRTLKAGVVYGGLPYITRGGGNLYRVAEFYDPETGTLKPEGDIFKDYRLLGNACSGGTSNAWARVITSAYLGYSMFLTQANGYLPVGPYRYSQPEVTRFIKKRIDPNGYDCTDICKENGEQVMFESYAMMKPADGVGCNGHVRMNTADPVVVRNEDGTIDGDQSYTLMTEQVCYVRNRNCLRIAEDGSHYTCQGFVDIKYSFNDLFKTNYIPFTFAEFQNPSKVEKAVVLLSVETELKLAVLTSNYPISDVFCETNGKKYAFRTPDFFRKEVKMGDIFPEEALVGDVKVSCQLYNGETIEVDARR